MDRKWTVVHCDGFDIYENRGGRRIALAQDSGRGIVERDGYAFRDLDGSGELVPYKDWRLSPEERAADLSGRLSIEEIAGLMLYSPHQAIPGKGLFDALFSGTYGGKKYADAGVKPWALSDQQKNFLKNDHLRHVLVTVFEDTETAARWNNAVQALVEGIGHGIPVNTSTDPRHSSDSSSEFNAGAGGKDISKWPEHLGLAATFDPGMVRRFGRVAAMEYRALGIATALSPQIDISTDPRWMRFNGSFGEDPVLATDMARACCEGFQTSEAELELADGWGYGSVNAMVKHWPGGGSGEAGRDAHYAAGKYAVYPANNFEMHMRPFVEGAFRLSGGTRFASAVMPYYTISWGVDRKYGENVGNSYSRYITRDLLREQAGYEGVICTDWNITHDNDRLYSFTSGKCWGVEHLTIAERHYKALMNGVDQFGGNHEMAPILEAYAMGVREHGEEFMRRRFEASARRLLLNIFRPGLFDNPYLSVDESVATVGRRDFVQSGFEAQVKSIVCLKNRRGVLPIAPGGRVYMPRNHTAESLDWFGNTIPEREEYLIDPKVVEQTYPLAASAAEADFALVVMRTPMSPGFSEADAANGGNGYIPISLQYGPYSAPSARAESIAGGDPLEKGVNRCYRGKEAIVYNRSDLRRLLETRRELGDKPLVVILKMDKPTVVSEFEPAADAILVDFGVGAAALMEIVSGRTRPSGLLPLQIPRDMETVETQAEDLPRDMIPHRDSEGNVYDFAFGMDFAAVIDDERVKKYR